MRGYNGKESGKAGGRFHALKEAMQKPLYGCGHDSSQPNLAGTGSHFTTTAETSQNYCGISSLKGMPDAGLKAHLFVRRET